MTIELELKAFPGQHTQSIIDYSEDFKLVSTETQLNHYFSGSLSPAQLTSLSEYDIDWTNEKHENLLNFIQNFSQAKQSIRTRYSSFYTYPHSSTFVLKATKNDTSSENGTARVELEFEIGRVLDKLDNYLISSLKLEYLSKWSRKRVTYKWLPEDITVCVDVNAGYGTILEVELMTEEKEDYSADLDTLRYLLQIIEAKEIPTSHMDEMFQVYNKDWEKFYGTSLTFADFNEYAHLLSV
jgi:adenylate cyclase class IV